MRFLYIIILGSILFNSCKHNKEAYMPMAKNSSVQQVIVKEVIQGGTYTFLQVKDKNQKFWIAANKTNNKVDDVIYFKNALKMVDFKSKELDRVFDVIYFVQNISDTPQFTRSLSKDSVPQIHDKNGEIIANIKVDPAPDGITIGELLKNGENYANKKVTIRGRVVKVNKNIMDRNWVHLKDGTSDAGKSDLTFTTLAIVNVGDIITFQGTVAIDKKYGAGYVYPLIVEEAILK